MNYSTIHGTIPSITRTLDTITVDSHSMNFKQGVDIRPQLKEVYSDMVDYEFCGHEIIIYIKKDNK